MGQGSPRLPGQGTTARQTEDADARRDEEILPTRQGEGREFFYEDVGATGATDDREEWIGYPPHCGLVPPHSDASPQLVLGVLAQLGKLTLLLGDAVKSQ